MRGPPPLRLSGWSSATSAACSGESKSISFEEHSRIQNLYDAQETIPVSQRVIKRGLCTQGEGNGPDSVDKAFKTIMIMLKEIKDILKMNIRSGKLRREMESLRKEPRGKSRFENVREPEVR